MEFGFRGGVCIQRGLHPEGFAYKGVCIQWGLYLGGPHPGGLPLWGGGVGQTPGILRDRVNERVVRILLECIFVLCFSFWLSLQLLLGVNWPLN